MKYWIYITILTCAYGFLKAVHPTTHFLTQYLEGPWINLTHTQVNNEVYPVWTYSYLCFLPATFLLILFVHHKPIIILECITLAGTWAILIWVPTLWAMQLMQVVYGLATACEVGYDTYIYAKVPRNKYRKVNSHIKAAVLVGRVLSAVSAQILITSQILDYQGLCYISLSFAILAGVFAFLLPATNKSGLEEDDDSILEIGKPIKNFAKKQNSNCKVEATSEFIEKTAVDDSTKSKVMQRLFFQMRTLYSKRSLVEWSLWWALGSCGGYQVGNYIQTLWEEIYPQKENRDLYNGAVDAVKTILGTVVTLGIGYVNVDWGRYGQLTIGIISVINAGLLYVMAQTESIWVCYGTNCIFRAFHLMLTTIASYQVAKESLRVNQPLIIGCNTFLALVFQTILTVIVVDKRALGLDPRSQFLVYSGFFVFIGAVFSVLAVVQMFFHSSIKNNKLECNPESTIVQNNMENTQSV